MSDLKIIEVKENLEMLFQAMSDAQDKIYEEWHGKTPDVIGQKILYYGDVVVAGFASRLLNKGTLDTDEFKECASISFFAKYSMIEIYAMDGDGDLFFRYALTAEAVRSLIFDIANSAATSP